MPKCVVRLSLRETQPTNGMRCWTPCRNLRILGSLIQKLQMAHASLRSYVPPLIVNINHILFLETPSTAVVAEFPRVHVRPVAPVAGTRTFNWSGTGTQKPNICREGQLYNTRYFKVVLQSTLKYYCSKCCIRYLKVRPYPGT